METCIDVSDLEPCEPLQRTLEAVRGLRPGDRLRVIHRREPRLLFPLLERDGFDWVCRPGEAGGFEILIWRAGDLEAEAGARTGPTPR